jgi:hypothetical protein
MSGVSASDATAMTAPWSPAPEALALIEKFKQDFDSLKRPAYPLLPNELMEERVRDYFVDRQWFEIDSVSFSKARDSDGVLAALFYRDHEYFAYFLPGFILMSLRDDPNESRRYADLTLYALTHDDPDWKSLCFKDDPRGWERVFDAYTATQKEDIALFLRYVIEHDPSSCWEAGKAYHSYWVRFDPHTLFPVPADLPRRHRAYSPPYTLHRRRDSSIKDT